MARLTEKERQELRKSVREGATKKAAPASTPSKASQVNANDVLKALGGTPSQAPSPYKIPDRSNLAPGASPYGMNQNAPGALQQFMNPTVDNFQAAQINAARPKLFEAVPQFQKEHPLYTPSVKKVTGKISDIESKVFQALGVKPNKEKEFPSYFEKQQAKEAHTGPIENLIGGLASGATFGLTKKAEEALYGPLAKGGYNTKVGRTGELVGSFVQPGSKAIAKGIGKLPVTNKLVKSVLEGSALGAAGQVGQEVVDVGFGGRDSLKERAKRVGEATALGGGLGLGGEIVGAAVRKLGGFAKRIAEQTTANSPQFRQVVNMLGEDGAKAQVGKQNLADLDEQLLNTSRGNAPDKQTQVKNLLNERKEVVNYIKQFEPEFDAGLPKLRGERQPVSIPPEVKPPISTETPQTSAIRPPREQGVRSNFETMRESGAFKPETADEINKLDQTYDIAKNVNTINDANELMRNPEQALEIFNSNALLHNKKNPIHTALAYRLMQHYGNLGQHKKSADIAEKIAEDLTNQGQGTQAASIVNRLSPEGQLILLSRKAQKNGGKLDDADKVNFQEAAHEKRASMGAETRADAYTELLDKLDSGHMPTPDELQLLQTVSERTKKYVPETKAETPKQPKTKREQKTNKALEALDREAQAARARLKASRNVGIVPGAGNPFVDTVIIATDMLAKGIVNSKNYVGEFVREFGEQARPQAKKIFNAAKARLSNNPDLRHLKEQADVLDDVVRKFERNVAPNAEDLKKIRELANDLKKLEGKTAQDADIQMQKIFQKYNKASVGDKIQAFRYLMMLGQESTQLLNIVPTATLQPLTDFFGNAVATAIDAAMSKLVKGRRRTRSIKGANPFTWYRDYAKNFYKGARYNWHGLNPAGLETADEVRGLALNSPVLKYGTLGVLPIYERSVKALSGGADYAVYQTVYDRELMRQAFLDAKQRGIKDKADMENHMKQFMDNPDPDAVEVADRQARRATFQSEKSTGGQLAKMVSSSHPAINFMAKAAVPFIRTPANIASHAFSLTPAGFIKGGIKLAYAKTPGQRSDALRELGLSMTGGAGLTYLGYKLHELGVITDENESGKGEVDKLNEQVTGGAFRFNQSAFKRVFDAMVNGGDLKEAGKHQEGDITFDYNKLQPIAFPVAVGASFEQQQSEGKGVAESTGQAALSGVGSLLSMSALKGVQDITNTGFNRTPAQEATGIGQRYIESYLKSFSPAIGGREARRTDTTQRQAPTGKGFGSIPSNVLGYYQSRTPSYLGKLGIPTSEELPERVTALGDVKTYPKGYWGSINPLKSQEINYNEAAKILYDLIERTGVTSIAPSAPDKKISGKLKSNREETEIELTPQEYAQYQKDIGGEITQRIISINANTELNDSQKVKQIDKAMDRIKKKYTNRIRTEKGMYIKK